MKIALLTDGIHPYVIGGMQKHSYYLAKYLARNGVQVDLYHFQQIPDSDIQSLSVFSEEEKKFINAVVIDFPSQDIFPGHYIRASYRYSERIFDHFKNGSDVDFIYAKGFSAWKLMEEKAKGKAFPPVGVKFHGMNMFHKAYSLRSRMEQMLLRPAAQYNLSHADHVFSYGGRVTDIIRDNAHVPQEKIVEVPTGVQGSWINPEGLKNNEILRFVYVGRYERLKGVEELMNAIMALLEKYSFEFHFIGPIPDHLRERSSRMIYHGVISSQEDLQEILRNSDILVCPSYSEGMPNAVLEAMASGMAVIASDVGAVNLLVSEKTGWLIRPGNTEDIQMAMIDAITSSQQEKNAGTISLSEKKENARALVKEKFVWDSIAKVLIKKITDIVSK